MEWAEVAIKTTGEGIEIVNGFLTAHGVPCVMIEDAGDFNRFLNDTTIYWDYVDDELMKMASCDTMVKFYLADNPQGFETLQHIKGDLYSLKEVTELDLGSLELTVSYKEEEEWETAWRKYYHPIVISDRLVVVPEWEQYEAKEGQQILWLNPGMAFGTGSHHTTKLCLEFLSEMVNGSEEMLDMGCGSGILSIAALLLGAKEVIAVDIDQLATKIAGENAELNHVAGENFKVCCGNVLSDEALCDTLAVKQYDLIAANIVADIIIAMAPLFKRLLKATGTLLVSGIIGERAEEVKYALRETGFTLLEERLDNDWAALKLCL